MASVTEFLSVWALGGKASLNPMTNNGLTTVGFECTLGHPGASHSIPAFFPPPSPPTPSPPSRPRHRGPAEREKNRLRAARHQATHAKDSVPESSAPVTALTSPSPANDSTASNTGATVSVTTTTVSEADNSISFQCDKCDFVSNSEHGVKVHKGTKHREA